MWNLNGCKILKTSAPQYLSTQLRFDNQRNDLIKSVIGFFNLINIVYACTKHIESTFSFIPSQENMVGDFLRCEDYRMRVVQAWPHRGLYKQTIFCLQILAAQKIIQTNNIQLGNIGLIADYTNKQFLTCNIVNIFGGSCLGINSKSCR